MGTIRLLCIVSAILFSISIPAGCRERDETTPLELTAYNHTDGDIGWYSVEIGNQGRIGAGFLAPGSGGGGFTCCIFVPTTWNPEIKIKVSGLQMVGNEERKFVKLVSVPKYDAETAGSLNVHFLRSGDIKVFVTRIMLGHRDYPLKGREAELKSGVPIKIIWP